MDKYGDCSFCGGEVTVQHVELDYRYKGGLYVFRNVPAGVCQQCGEKYLTAIIAKLIQNTIHTRREWDETISVPVTDFGNMADNFSVSAPVVS